MKGIFVAGTDTDVGKTYVSCLVLKGMKSHGWKVGAYKPVASGFPSWSGSDGERLWDSCGQIWEKDHVSPQRFLMPLAPPVAARLESKVVDDSLILSGFTAWTKRCDYLLVEGAGGLLSPVSDQMTNADLIRTFDLPVLLVTEWKLGVVNQVLTSMIAARSMGISVVGVVLNASMKNRLPEHAISDLELLKQFLEIQFPKTHVEITTLNHGESDFCPSLNFSELFR